MMEKLIWLSVSLYCKQNLLHLLIRDAIKPFIDTAFGNGLLHHWYFEINDQFGCNVRLPLLVSKELVHETTMEAKEYFTTFFDKLPYESSTTLIPTDQLFLPLPEPSVQFGLYDAWENKGDFKTRQIIAEILVALIDTSGLDDETVFSIYLYTIFIFLETALRIRPKKLNTLRQYFFGQDTDLLEQLPSDIKDQFESNEEVIDEMWEDVFDHQSIIKEYPALLQWSALCSKRIEKDNDNETMMLVDLLRVQLSISPHSYLLTKYILFNYWERLIS